MPGGLEACRRRCRAGRSRRCRVAVRVAAIDRRQVELAVAVEVADRQRTAGRCRWRRSGPRWNVPSPLPSSTLTALLPALRRGQVEVAVVVEVGRHHGLGVRRRRGSSTAGAEAGQAAVFQGFEAGRCVAARGGPRLSGWRWPGVRAERRFCSQLGNDMVVLPSRLVCDTMTDTSRRADRAPGRCRAGGGLAWR